MRSSKAGADDVLSARRAGRKLVQDPKKIDLMESVDRQAWYKDGLAWSMIGTGAAALGTGLALWRVFDTSSAEETWAWALIAAGGGFIVTGTVLFFFPVAVRGTSSFKDEEQIGLGFTMGGVF